MRLDRPAFAEYWRRIWHSLFSRRDLPLDLEPIGGHLAKRGCRGSIQHLPEVQVVIELGRYLVGEAGIYVSASRR